MSDLISALQKARKASKLSQSAMSELLHLPQSHISKIESGKTDLRVSSLEDMAHVLGLEVMLVPKAIVPYVQATIRGDDVSATPRWQPDEEVV